MRSACLQKFLCEAIFGGYNTDNVLSEENRSRDWSGVHKGPSLTQGEIYLTPFLVFEVGIDATRLWISECQ